MKENPELPALFDLGWNDALAAAFRPHEQDGRVPARVSAEHKNLYRVFIASEGDGELLAEISGSLRHAEQFPAVGDWVAATVRDEGHATIHAVLPRRSHFARMAAGLVTRRQVVAANVDFVFLMQGLDRDFNPRRLERYLLLSWEGGVNPVIVLNKADTCDDVNAHVDQVARLGAPVTVVSALHGHGMEALRPYLQQGRTVAALGSSGAGKSTLVNRLLGHDLLPTRSVREDDQRGRHTTTHRQLVPLPDGGLILDTPGMRELAIVDGEGLDDAFSDLAAFAAHCRFNDCSHSGEPGCAVQAALDDASLSPARMEAWRKLKREQRHVAMRTDQRLRIQERKKWKAITRQLRARH